MTYDEIGKALADAELAGGADELLDLGRRQVLARADLGVRAPAGRGRAATFPKRTIGEGDDVGHNAAKLQGRSDRTLPRRGRNGKVHP